MNSLLKISLLLSACLIMNLMVFSQTKYEEGYFISNDGVRTDCLIKNGDWIYNPVSFEYKKYKDADRQLLTISEVKEFGITNYSKYVRASVNIDVSRGEEDIDELSDSAQPQWQSDTLFLKVIIAGDATLFYYEGKTPARFFYQVSGSPVQQLIYKAYKSPETEAVYYNDDFHKQLFQNANCNNETFKNIQVIRYKISELKDYFATYNRCKGNVVFDPINKKKKKMFLLSLVAGADNTSLTDGYPAQYPGGSTTNALAFPGKVSFAAGVEGEFLLPFNNNEWSLPLGLGYHSYNDHASSDVRINNSVSNTEGDIIYNTVVLTTSLRHYFFINDKESVFINAGLAYNILAQDSYSSNIGTQYPRFLINVIGGIGYRYNKAALEFSYYSPGNIFPNSTFTSSLKRISLTLKYELF